MSNVKNPCDYRTLSPNATMSFYRKLYYDYSTFQDVFGLKIQLYFPYHKNLYLYQKTKPLSHAVSKKNSFTGALLYYQNITDDI